MLTALVRRAMWCWQWSTQTAQPAPSTLRAQVDSFAGSGSREVWCCTPIPHSTSTSAHTGARHLQYVFRYEYGKPGGCVDVQANGGSTAAWARARPSSGRSPGGSGSWPPRSACCQPSMQVVLCAGRVF
jgi:hypothetical protein